MPNILTSRKGEFFVLTAVIIVGVFYAMSRYINPYAFIDTSSAARGGEIFFFNNVKDKAEKTVRLSDSYDDLKWNLLQYKDFVEYAGADEGYRLVFSYDIAPYLEIPGYPVLVRIRIVLSSENARLESTFPVEWIYVG